jgi:hypothetical protein
LCTVMPINEATKKPFFVIVRNLAGTRRMRDKVKCDAKFKINTARSESRCALRLQYTYVDLVVSIEVAVCTRSPSILSRP